MRAHTSAGYLSSVGVAHDYAGSPIGNSSCVQPCLIVCWGQKLDRSSLFVVDIFINKTTSLIYSHFGTVQPIALFETKIKINSLRIHVKFGGELDYYWRQRIILTSHLRIMK